VTHPVSAACPHPDTLARFAEGTLPRREVHAVLEPIADCDTCTRAVRGASETVAANRPRRNPMWVAAAALVITGATVVVLSRNRGAETRWHA
jgi:hypothetical protein